MSGSFSRFAALVAALVPVSLHAQQARDSVRLDEVIVTASRDAVRARVRSAAADLLDPEELARRQVSRLQDALRLLPGSSLVGNGGVGGTTAIFMRGTTSYQTLLLIDGIRVNDANADPASLVGGFDLSLGDRLEVARGPQSTQFGGAAIGGVVSVAGRIPELGSRIGVETEAGGFETYRARGFGAIRSGKLGIAVAASLIDTENQRPNNQYDQRTQSIRLEHQTTPDLRLGASFRGLQQSFTSPGDIRSTNTTPVGHTTFDNTLGTVFADARLARVWNSRLTLGGQDYFLRGEGQFDGTPFTSLLDVTRWVADWQNRLTLSPHVAAIVGANAEWTDVRDADGPKDERLRAGYGELIVTPSPNVHLSAGARHDDYSTFGSKTTGRFGAGFFIPAAQLKLRGTVGTGFMPPSLAGRYGSAFLKPNPALRPERSRGYDLGVDRFFAAGRAVASVTWFRNELEDLIAYQSGGPPDFLGQNVNINRARTSGIEVSARAQLASVDARISYTWLKAEDLSAPEADLRRLIRRPKHGVGFDLAWTGRRLTLGAGASGAFDRVDTDFNPFPAVRVDPGDYVDARLYGEWRFSSGFGLRARLENIFNEIYEEAYGFPTLGRRLTVGLTFDRSR